MSKTCRNSTFNICCRCFDRIILCWIIRLKCSFCVHERVYFYFCYFFFSVQFNSPHLTVQHSQLICCTYEINRRTVCVRYWHWISNIDCVRYIIFISYRIVHASISSVSHHLFTFISRTISSSLSLSLPLVRVFFFHLFASTIVWFKIGLIDDELQFDCGFI